MSPGLGQETSDLFLVVIISRQAWVLIRALLLRKMVPEHLSAFVLTVLLGSALRLVCRHFVLSHYCKPP